MVDRVQLQKIVNYIVEKEKEKIGIQRSSKEAKEVEVTLSQIAKSKNFTDYEDIQKKVDSIREQISKGAYHIDPERIVKGIEKFLSLR